MDKIYYSMQISFTSRVDGVHTVQPATPWRKDAKDLFQNKSYGAETIYLKEDKSNA